MIVGDKYDWNLLEQTSRTFGLKSTSGFLIIDKAVFWLAHVFLNTSVPKPILILCAYDFIYYYNI